MVSRRERRKRRSPRRHVLFLLLYSAGLLGTLAAGDVARGYLPPPARAFFPELRRLLPDGAALGSALSSSRAVSLDLAARVGGWISFYELRGAYYGPHLEPEGGSTTGHGEPAREQELQQQPTPSPRPERTAGVKDSAALSGQPAAPPFLSNGDPGVARFRIKLVQLEKGLRRRVRVVHFGDSMLWYENTARRMRTQLQESYGDGGRGFVYLHGQDFGITLDGHESRSSGYILHAIPYNHFNHARPKWLPEVGFLGLTYQARVGARSRQWTTTDAQPWTSVKAILRPLPGQEQATVLRVYDPDTDAELGSARSARPSGCAMIEAQIPPSRQLGLAFPAPAGSDQSAFIDAVLLETERGVSYSSVILKGRHMAWLTAVPEESFRCGFAALAPDLVVMQFGINESASIDWHAYGFTEADYLRQARELFRRIRAAHPEADILLIGPYERLKSSGGGGWVNYAAHDRVRQLQKELALEMGLAFFDSWSFLGGEGQLRRLIPKRLAHNDYAHLTMAGGDLLAEGIFRELAPAPIRAARAQPSRDVRAPPGVTAEGKQAPTRAPAAAFAPVPSDVAGIAGDVDTRTADTVGGGVGAASNATGGSPILFNSREFLWFFVGVLFCSVLLLRFPKARLVFLVAASWYFYASWKWWALSLIVGSTVLDYLAGLGVARSRRLGGRGTLYLVVSLVGNLGLLFFFKYHDFFVGLINPTLPAHLQLPVLKLILPVGISFYTFQTLSYTIDVWRGILPVERRFLNFALFVAFFPQLVAGPIVRAAQFLPGLTARVRHFVLTRTRAAEAFLLIFSGLFKKALADTIAVNLVDRVFQTPQMYTVTETVLGVYGFAVQIYLDFSSYTDMALGCAALLGFRLTENFRSPYSAVTISDFWRRWHISLGSWLRDYLYMSLGGNRSRVLVNLALTMLLAGLWHGAGVNFILWGAFHGALLMLERLFGLHRLSGADLALPVRILARFVVFHLVLLGWVLFRCGDLDVARELWAALGTRVYVAPNLDLPILLSVALPLLWHWLPEERKSWLKRQAQKMPALLQGVLGAALALGAYRIASAEARAFLYFQF